MHRILLRVGLITMVLAAVAAGLSTIGGAAVATWTWVLFAIGAFLVVVAVAWVMPSRRELGRDGSGVEFDFGDWDAD